MEASSQELKSDLSFEEGEEQSQHAAEQLILQTVKHCEAIGGIQAHNIVKETRIKGNLVDKALKELIRRREVMLSRSGVNIFYLPFKMPEPKRMIRPVRKISEDEKVKEDVQPAAAPAVQEKPKPSWKSREISGKCPVCGTILTSHQQRHNLIAQMMCHLQRMHKKTKDEARDMLVAAGEVPEGRTRGNAKPTTAAQRVKKIPSEPAPEINLQLREAVQMGELMAPPLPADRHEDTGEYPEVEISAEAAEDLILHGRNIPREMNEDRPTPTWGMGIHDVLELVKQIAAEAGIRMTYVYGCTETDACTRERLSMDLEG